MSRLLTSIFSVSTIRSSLISSFSTAQHTLRTTNFGHCHIADAELLCRICVVPISCYILARIDVALCDDLLNRISDSFMGAEDVMNLKV
jgi:hypothetical protein